MTEDLTLDEWRPRLVAAMLPHVPFDGWARDCVHRAADDLGLSRDLADLVFPDGAIAMVDAYIASADVAMVAALSTPDFAALKVREKVTTAILTRLEQAVPHREAIRRASAILALPGNAARTARLTWRTADRIWRLCGDNATDFNHYSKRAILGAVYASTLLVWVNDDSENFADTRGFLDRRIAGIMQFEKLKARLKGSGDGPSLARFLGRLRYPVEG